MTEPKCLKCGGEIEYYDCYDIECDEEAVIRHYSGYCMECETDHLWSEVYKFEKIEKLRIESDGVKDE